jgi:hypothetical protein
MCLVLRVLLMLTTHGALQLLKAIGDADGLVTSDEEEVGNNNNDSRENILEIN